VEVFRTIFVYLLSVAIIVGAVMFAVSQSPTKSIFGFRYYTVLTDSMKPEFVTGDMVIVKLKNATDIQQGDVITFNPSSDSEAYLTHRVTEKLENYEGTGVTCFKTKGDANNTEDSFLIDESRVIGTVKFYLPKLGYILRFVQLRWYFIAPLVILLFVFMELLKRYFELRNGKDDEDRSEGSTAQN
jgi:signal peptidase